jgi:hypothetical protein
MFSAGLLMLLSSTSISVAQVSESPIRTFGYFQNSFQHWSKSVDHPRYNTFAMQQLNLFLQKDLARDWTALVNFEVLNNFSSSRRWGSFNAEEAWVRYRASRQFNLKVGLQIPVFNNLNEIKNRMPLLPYIVRPLVYETSFNEFIAIEEFLPNRAYIQAYGFIPSGRVKIDYAGYVGNSPNINSQFDNEETNNERQTGVDTTTTFLFGGRVGLRYKELKAGISATHERVNYFKSLGKLLGEPSSKFEELPRIRLGTDVSYRLGDFSFEGEYISVEYDEGTDQVDFDKKFFYGTLGWNVTEPLFLYASYWQTEEHNTEIIENDFLKFLVDVEVVTGGLSYNLSDRIALKGQVAIVMINSDLPPSFFSGTDFEVYSLAISIFF